MALPILDPSQAQQATREAPVLQIPIPGVTLTSVTDPNDYSIPWIGQYVSGVYTFLISIIGLVAAIMMIIGGFEYLTSAGDSGKIGKSKKRITDALIGMVLALGSYALLYTINPDLVVFKGLNIQMVVADPILDSLMESTASTSDPVSSDAAPPQSSSGAPSTADAPFTGTIYKTCPLTIADTSMNGIPAFMNLIRANMGTIVNAKTPMDKAVQIGNIAAVCNMHLGNCGKSVGTFFALAGVLNDPKCNQNSNNNKDCNAWPDVTVHSVPDTKFVWWARCDNEQALSIADKPACTSPGPWSELPSKGKACNGKCMCTRSDCVNGRFAATAKVGRDLLEYAKKEPRMAGWPDSYVKDLKRGDWVIMYNGNGDKTGGHSAMFVAWADKDTMISINGDAKTGVHYSKQCITSGCINKPQGWGMWNPVTRILRQSTH